MIEEFQTESEKTDEEIEGAKKLWTALTLKYSCPCGEVLFFTEQYCGYCGVKNEDFDPKAFAKSHQKSIEDWVVEDCDPKEHSAIVNHELNQDVGWKYCSNCGLSLAEFLKN